MDGNQVKMREALEEAKRFILDVQGFLHGMETTFPGETEIIQKINAALSAPPRNCDVGKDVRTLLEEYIAMRGFTSDNQIRALYELALPVIEWLLAPSEKMKGESRWKRTI